MIDLVRNLFRKKIVDNKSDFVIKDISSCYKEKLLVLFETVFKEKMSAEFWDWKYSKSKYNIVLVDEDDSVVGHYGGMYRQLVVFGDKVAGVQVCDTMIATKARGGTGKKSRLYLLTTKFIYESMVKNRHYALVYGFPHKRVMRAAELLNIYTKSDSIVECSWGAIANSSIDKDKVVINSSYAIEVDGLWRLMLREFEERIVGVRDFDYLEYRYINHPKYKYELYGIVQNDKLCSVIIGRKDGDIFRLMDIIATADEYKGCIALAQNIAFGLGCENVAFWITKSSYDYFKDLNCTYQDMNVTIATSEIGNYYKITDIENRWWLTAGDSDFL